ERVLVVVEAYSQEFEGSFTLTAESRPANQCGDAFVDELEQCDDGGVLAGDGCDPDCQVESTEAEHNDTFAQATSLTIPTWASIWPAGDVDYYRLTVEDGPKDIVVDARNLGSG